MGAEALSDTASHTTVSTVNCELRGNDHAVAMPRRERLPFFQTFKDKQGSSPEALHFRVQDVLWPIQSNDNPIAGKPVFAGKSLVNGGISESPWCYKAGIGGLFAQMENETH